MFEGNDKIRITTLEEDKKILEEGKADWNYYIALLYRSSLKEIALHHMESLSQ